MTISNLEQYIISYVAQAEIHARHCVETLATDDLAGALAYCRTQGIDPPQCSLSAQSINAETLRMKARRMLSDIAWWKKRLETYAVRSYEAEQIRAGNVTNYVSDDVLEYSQKRKR